MGERRSLYRLWVGKTEGKKSLGKPKCGWEDTIKVDFKEIVWEGMK
jgi:hypothetical protein